MTAWAIARGDIILSLTLALSLSCARALSTSAPAVPWHLHSTFLSASLYQTTAPRAFVKGAREMERERERRKKRKRKLAPTIYINTFFQLEREKKRKREKEYDGKKKKIKRPSERSVRSHERQKVARTRLSSPFFPHPEKCFKTLFQDIFRILFDSFVRRKIWKALGDAFSFFFQFCFVCACAYTHTFYFFAEFLIIAEKHRCCERFQVRSNEIKAPFVLPLDFSLSRTIEKGLRSSIRQ